MRRLIFFFLFFVMIGVVYVQFIYGIIGLLNMFIVDMQCDKMFMFGGGFLEKYVIFVCWIYNIFNYYFDIIIFFWLEVFYICILYKVMEVDFVYGLGFWVFFMYGKFVN